MELKVVNLNKFYETQHVLQDLNFQVHSGQIVGFLGVNGAGKSTTMRILCGILQADSGQVYIDQRSLSELGQKAQHKIGYLSEHNPLYGDLFVWEYLDFIARVRKIPKAKQTINQLLERLGVIEERKKKLDQLSKGYRQRIGLAAALIHKPEILILDEPTSGLDPKQMIEIRKLISEFGNEKIVFLSSHVLQEVAHICNHILIIHNGKIVADSPSNKLQTKNIRIQWNNKLTINDFETLQPYCEQISHDGEAWLFFPKKQIESENNTLEELQKLREHILGFSMDKGLNLFSLTESADELESIFQDLTKN